MGETRNPREGTLRWVQGSGSGAAWATASAPTSGLIGYVTNMTRTIAQTMEPVMQRGTPTHWKKVDDQAVALSWDLLWGVTGDYPVFASGSGASVPLLHLEFKATAPEALAGIWEQYHGVVADSIALTETNPVNTQTWTCRALSACASTASGYLS